MINLRFKALLGAGCISVAMMGGAQAGGFSRGSADTDIIFEPGNFNMRSSVTYVSPTRKFNKNGNPRLIGTNYAEDYIIPSFAAKFNLTDNLRCAGTLVNNNGGNARYASPTLSGKISEEFTTYESALTCGLGFDAGQGKFWLLGGGFMEKFEYNRVNSYAALGMGNATLNLDGQKYGFRIGAAYEIPDIALRAQLMYRSGTKYGADALIPGQAGETGNLVVKGMADTAGYGPAILPEILVLADGEARRLRANVEGRQLAPVGPLDAAESQPAGRNTALQLELDALRQGANADRGDINGRILAQRRSCNDPCELSLQRCSCGRSEQNAGRRIQIAVGTGWDITGDTYTVAVGGSAKDGIGGEFRGGVGFSYLGAGEETNYAPGTNQGVKAGYAIAFNAGYSLKW